MDGTGIEQKNFIAYEYKQIIAESNKASLLLDGYESFGWEPDENLSGNTESAYGPSLQRVLLHLKRNRKIINKFSITAQTPNILLCILFAVPAFIGWVLPFFIFR